METPTHEMNVQPEVAGRLGLREVCRRGQLGYLLVRMR